MSHEPNPTVVEAGKRYVRYYERLSRGLAALGMLLILGGGVTIMAFSLNGPSVTRLLPPGIVFLAGLLIWAVAYYIDKKASLLAAKRALLESFTRGRWVRLRGMKPPINEFPSTMKCPCEYNL